MGKILYSKIETTLKEIILKEYGSLQNFCEHINMPWSTLNSILERGVNNAKMSNIIKICKSLNISLDGLIKGKIIFNFNLDNNTENLEYNGLVPKIQYKIPLYEDLNYPISESKVVSYVTVNKKSSSYFAISHIPFMNLYYDFSSGGVMVINTDYQLSDYLPRLVLIYFECPKITEDEDTEYTYVLVKLIRDKNNGDYIIFDKKLCQFMFFGDVPFDLDYLFKIEYLNNRSIKLKNCTHLYEYEDDIMYYISRIEKIDIKIIGTVEAYQYTHNLLREYPDILAKYEDITEYEDIFDGENL